MSSWRSSLILVASCAATQVAPLPPPEPPPVTITPTSFGPLTATTPATLVSIRRAFASFEVRPTHDHGLEYRVYERDHHMFTVNPTNDGTIFNIDVASPRIAIAGHDAWRIGSPLRDPRSLDACACWGGKPICYHAGDHVALGFDRKCSGLAKSRRSLEGMKIARAVWSPQPFGEERDDGGDSYAEPVIDD